MSSRGLCPAAAVPEIDTALRAMPEEYLRRVQSRYIQRVKSGMLAHVKDVASFLDSLHLVGSLAPEGACVCLSLSVCVCVCVCVCVYVCVC